MTQQDEGLRIRIENLEKRLDAIEVKYDKVDEKTNKIFTELAKIGEILKVLNVNVEKIGESSIDKIRVEKLEQKVSSLEYELQEKTTKHQAEKWEKAKWIVISSIMTAVIGFIIGMILK